MNEIASVRTTNRLEERRLFTDVYHFFLVSSWRKVLLSFLGVYLGVNLFFAGLYVLGGDSIDNARPGSWHDAFFFSVQTISTIGYGKFAPKTTYANIIVAAEAFCGLLGFAMGSGLMFAKFSRPTARVVFSHNAVITRRDGKPVLTFRMANSRSNQILEAQLRMVLLTTEKTLEGEMVRRIRDLNLVRDRSPAFIFTWSAYHPIDEQSPFFKKTQEEMRGCKAEIMVTLTGIDGTFNQVVHTRHRYILDDILWSHRLVDIMSLANDGVPEINYGKFHDVTPEAPRV